jgi:hypothetical protein
MFVRIGLVVRVRVVSERSKNKNKKKTNAAEGRGWNHLQQ